MAELRTPSRIRENLDIVEIVLGLLSSGGGKPEKLLGVYVDRVLKMKKRPFSKKVASVLYHRINAHTYIDLHNGM